MFTALLSLTALEAGASDCGIAPFFVSRTFGDTRGWLDHPGLISLQTAEVAPDVFWDDQPPPPPPPVSRPGVGAGGSQNGIWESLYKMRVNVG